jgi:hypothetical protein
MRGKVMLALFGIGSALIGLSSLIPGIPIPFNCKTTVCEIGTAPISLDIVLLAGGLLLFFISRLIGKTA